MNKVIFAKRESIEQVEEGKVLAPKFDLHGIIPAVVNPNLFQLSENYRPKVSMASN